MTGTDLIAKDILSVTIKAVIGTRPGPRLSTVFTKIKRPPEVPVRHKRTQIRTEISQQPPFLPLPLTTWNKGSFIVAKLFDWRRFAERMTATLVRQESLPRRLELSICIWKKDSEMKCSSPPHEHERKGRLCTATRAKATL